MPKQSNIKIAWKIFVAALTAITIGFVILLYFQWQANKSQFQAENENLTKIVAQASKSYFEQIDIQLMLLGNQLLVNNNYKVQDKSKTLFEKTFRINDAIIGYALIAPNGKFLLSGTDIDPEVLTGLLDRKESKETFLETLQTDKIQLGRTYFLSTLEQYAIPIRKTIFNDSKQPIAVISVAISVEQPTVFDEYLLSSNAHIIQLLRDKDRYRQLYIFKSVDEQVLDPYSKPIPEALFESTVADLASSEKITIADLKKSNKIVSFEVISPATNIKYLGSTVYLSDYKLWTSSYVRYEKVINAFLEIYFLGVALYLISIIVIWRLFAYVVKRIN